MRFLWKHYPRCFVILFTVVVFIFSAFSMGCNQQSATQNTPSDSQDIPVVEFSGLPLPGDIYYIDPVVTPNQELLMLGATNRDIQKLTKEFFAINPWNGSSTFIEDQSYPHLSSLITQPKWFQNEPFLYIESMTFHPVTRDIYLLITPKNRASVGYTEPPEEGGGQILPMTNLKTTSTQEILLVQNETIAKRYSITNEQHFSKIRIYTDSEKKTVVLFASTNEGTLYWGIPQRNTISLEMGHSKTEESYIAWDMADNTIVGLDASRQIHILPIISQEEKFPEMPSGIIPCPYQGELINPQLYYNPLSRCLILWDASTNGCCLYAKYIDETWEWKQMDISPTHVFPYFLSYSMQYDIQIEEDKESNLYNESLLFCCIGSKSKDQGPQFYGVFTNPY